MRSSRNGYVLVAAVLYTLTALPAAAGEPPPTGVALPAVSSAPEPALTVPAMSPFPSTLPAGKPLMSLEAPTPDSASRSPILACNPPAPSAVVFAECCNKGSSTYAGKYEFCYCTPAKLAQVCRLGPGASAYPLLKEGTRCIALSTHPLWPGQNSACN